MHALPRYSELRAHASRPLPDELVRQEHEPPYRARVDQAFQNLRHSAERPPDDEPLFWTLAKSPTSLVSIQLPGGGLGLAVFSNSIRAADYSEVLLGGAGSFASIRSSASQLLAMFRSAEETAISSVVLDRCPRCSIFVATQLNGIKTVDQVLDWWAISVSSLLARLELFVRFSTEAMQSGDLQTAKEVALGAVGHVMPEDPRPHFLLGHLATLLGDRQLFDEARACLSALQQGTWSDELDRLAGARSWPVGAAQRPMPAREDSSPGPDDPTHTANTRLTQTASGRAGDIDPTRPHRISALGSVGDLVEGMFRIREIRSGGMGVVHIVDAQNPESGHGSRLFRRIAGQLIGNSDASNPRTFAIKTLKPNPVADFSDIERFERECLVWSTLLPHPNIVRALAAGRIHDTQPFVLLEYVDGGNLRTRIRERLSAAAALRIALHVCRGMSFLKDSAGIVHGDLKPENILLTSADLPKIADFGLVQVRRARAESPTAPQHGAEVADVSVGREATIAGSMPYMSPEQFLGRPADVRSDVYSFGVVLYEMFSGRRPFEHKTPSDYAHAHLHETPLALNAVESVQPGLNAVVMGCLAKQPADRFQDFADVGARIRGVCDEQGLDAIVPEEISLDALRATMDAADWHGRAEALLMIGEALHARDRSEAGSYLESANESFQRACQADKNWTSRRGALGRTLCLLRRDEEAVNHLRQHLRTDPPDVQPYEDLAGALERLGRIDEALEVFRAAEARFPRDPKIPAQRFGVAHRHGRDFDVEAAVRDAIVLVPPTRTVPVPAPWWKRIFENPRTRNQARRLNAVELNLPGWNEEDSEGNERVWRDRHASRLALKIVPMALPTSEEGIQDLARAVTAQGRAVLIEVGNAAGRVTMIYKEKTPHHPVLRVVTGNLLIPDGDAVQTWTLMCAGPDADLELVVDRARAVLATIRAKLS